MIKLTDNDIVQIAEQMDMGFRALFSKEDETFIFVPDEAYFMDDLDPENPLPGQEYVELIEDAPDDYIEIKKWSSSDFYNIMEGFAEEVRDISFQNALLDVLNRKKPFRRFEHLIENSDLRSKWFDYRDKKLQEYVRRELENEPELDVLLK